MKRTNDINLAVIGPRGADRPISGPNTAAVWHAEEVSNEKATAVLLVRGDADTRGATIIKSRSHELKFRRTSYGAGQAAAGWWNQRRA